MKRKKKYEYTTINNVDGWRFIRNVANGNESAVCYNLYNFYHDNTFPPLVFERLAKIAFKVYPLMDTYVKYDSIPFNVRDFIYRLWNKLRVTN